MHLNSTIYKFLFVTHSNNIKETVYHGSWSSWCLVLSFKVNLWDFLNRNLMILRTRGVSIKLVTWKLATLSCLPIWLQNGALFWISGQHWSQQHIFVCFRLFFERNFFHWCRVNKWKTQGSQLRSTYAQSKWRSSRNHLNRNECRSVSRANNNLVYQESHP